MLLACQLPGWSQTKFSPPGLPPLNGFVSEWLTLQTMLRSAELTVTLLKIIFVLCGAMLALTAALAVTCFVKAFAMGRRTVVENTGHLALAFHPEVLRITATELRANRVTHSAESH